MYILRAPAALMVPSSHTSPHCWATSLSSSALAKKARGSDAAACPANTSGALRSSSRRSSPDSRRASLSPGGVQ